MAAIMEIKYQIHWQIHDANQTDDLDPLVFQLLTFIQQLGSLRKAAEHANVSYRHAWGLLNKWQDTFGPLVILEKGRGAQLSKIGEKILHTHHQLHAKFSPELDNIATEVKRELTALNSDQLTPSLNIFASHGLAVSALRQLINQHHDFKLDLHFHGSLESLQALQSKQCDIAGFHIPIGPLATLLRPQYLDILHPKTHELVYVVRRNQGLMFRPEHETEIQNIHALTNPELKFINRQSGSGTRLLFDQIIKAEHISAHDITGYDDVEYTHLAVAALVASGMADISFGIASMADKFNLSFLPLVWEHYCLAIPKDICQDEAVQDIKLLLQSDRFKEALVDTTGYDTSDSGQTMSFDTIFRS